ncbi:hypothetical protein HID58_036120 [Brassica napus]|uniref:Uncharacterized protein n=1 Tax=Brassica napus TaxID=3708 RepID=A0ABQ8C6U8_BRANA|nr:hypothetical protein HID58_036120 [Brassica napus]
MKLAWVLTLDNLGAADKLVGWHNFQRAIRIFKCRLQESLDHRTTPFTKKQEHGVFWNFGATYLSITSRNNVRGSFGLRRERKREKVDPLLAPAVGRRVSARAVAGDRSPSIVLSEPWSRPYIVVHLREVNDLNGGSVSGVKARSCGEEGVVKLSGLFPGDRGSISSVAAGSCFREEEASSAPLSPASFPGCQGFYSSASSVLVHGFDLLEELLNRSRRRSMVKIKRGHEEVVRWRLASESSSGVTRVRWMVPAAPQRALVQVEADGMRVVPEEEDLVTCLGLLDAGLLKSSGPLSVWGVGPCSWE